MLKENWLTWRDYLSGKILLTAGERNNLVATLKRSYGFSDQQFEVFNRELIRRAGLKQNQRELPVGVAFYLVETQRKLLTDLVKSISPKQDLGELPQGYILEPLKPSASNIAQAQPQLSIKCQRCKSRVGESKTIFSSQIIANLHCADQKEFYQEDKESYKCPIGNGWHVRTADTIERVPEDVPSRKYTRDQQKLNEPGPIQSKLPVEVIACPSCSNFFLPNKTAELNSGHTVVRCLYCQQAIVV